MGCDAATVIVPAIELPSMTVDTAHDAADATKAASPRQASVGRSPGGSRYVSVHVRPLPVSVISTATCTSPITGSFSNSRLSCRTVTGESSAARRSKPPRSGFVTFRKASTPSRHPNGVSTP